MTIRLTAAQALVRYLSAQMTEEGVPFIAGVWAIFGHGNVAGMGEALHGARDRLPTWRGHNEQGMAHAAIAYAKQLRRRRAMAVTSSIGPGALNMVTAAGLAHVNRLPVLFLPGDVFAGRGPDPVLQQVEDFGDGTVSVNDCFRPVSRYFDRITRPEQLLSALPRAFRTMTDPADCGPVTLAFCQDVQAEAWDWPEAFFAPKVWRIRRPHPDPVEVAAVAALIAGSKAPVIVAGGGVHYSGAHHALEWFASHYNIPVVETQAGKSSLPWDHPLNLGPIGVTGAESANAACRAADVVIGLGTRFQDFTTGSWSLFAHPGRRLISINVAAYDASGAHHALEWFASHYNIPVVETQAGKSSLPWDHPLNLGPIGVTGAESANAACRAADVVIGLGTRFQDFTTGSWSLFAHPGRRLISINVAAYDAMKHGAEPLCADADVALEAIWKALGDHPFTVPDPAAKSAWFAAVDPLTAAPGDANALPTDQHVIGAVQRAAGPQTVVMGAAGTMPGELHKLWKAGRPMSYHMEYGFSCMGYEIAGAIGIRMAEPESDVICMVGDGSYLMLNAELATAVMMGLPFTVVLTDNRGYGCINRLQMATGGAEFNNLLDHTIHAAALHVDFAAHAASLGAQSVKVASVAGLEAALARRHGMAVPYVIVIDTDPYPSTPKGGHWWDVAVPEVSDRAEVQAARAAYDQNRKEQA